MVQPLGTGGGALDVIRTPIWSAVFALALGGALAAAPRACADSVPWGSASDVRCVPGSRFIVDHAGPCETARAGSGRGEHGAGAAGGRSNARGGARPSELAGPAEALPPSRSAAPSEPHLGGAGGLYDERAGRLAGCADPPGRSAPPPHAKSDCETLSTRTGAQHEP